MEGRASSPLAPPRSGYGELGFVLEWRFGFAEAGVEIAHVVSPAGLRLELIQQAGSVPTPDVDQDDFEALRTQGAKHVGLLVDDALAELRGKGVKLAHEVVVVEPAGVRKFWVRDNSGNLIEFNEWLV